MIIIIFLPLYPYYNPLIIETTTQYGIIIPTDVRQDPPPYPLSLLPKETQISHPT